jgi:hypothetical protein
MLFKLNIVKSFLQLCYLLQQRVEMLCIQSKVSFNDSFLIRLPCKSKSMYCITKVKTNNHIQVEYIEEHYRLLHVARSKRSDQHAHQNRWSRDKEICWWNKTYGPLICEPQIQTFHRSCHDNLEFVHQPVPLPEIITLSCNEIPTWSNILRKEKFIEFFFF